MPPKRSSTATASSSKRQKVDPIVQAGQTILELASQHEEAEADSESPTPPLTLTASQTRDLIAYTRYLVAASTPKTLSGPELTKEVSRLRNLIENGITKLMTVCLPPINSSPKKANTNSGNPPAKPAVQLSPLTASAPTHKLWHLSYKYRTQPSSRPRNGRPPSSRKRCSMVSHSRRAFGTIVCSSMAMSILNGTRRRASISSRGGMGR